MEQSAVTPKALLEAVRYFSDPDIAQDFFVKLRWPNGVVCPTCGSEAVTYMPTYRRWACRTKHPKRQFSAKVGTIFEDSPLSLEKWLPAVWLIANAKNGISSYELGRALSITQKSAWFMLQRIRLAMRTGSFDKMSGRVEADETFIGGAARNMHKDKKRERTSGKRGGAVGKTAIMGLLERHGPDKTSRVRAFVIPTNRKGELLPRIHQHVEPKSEVITDALSSYRTLDQDTYTHTVIDHAESYARGHVHTNGIENFWSLLKRAIKGTYVSVEPFHLFLYLDEQVFRFNHRSDRDGDGGRFVKVLRNATGRRLTYGDLTMSPA